MEEPTLSAIGKFQLKRYKNGKSILKQYEDEVFRYLEWEEEQQNKDK